MFDSGSSSSRTPLSYTQSPENSVPGLVLPQPDLARRVAGEVQHLELALAEVDHVALVEQDRRHHGFDAVRGGFEAS